MFEVKYQINKKNFVKARKRIKASVEDKENLKKQIIEAKPEKVTKVYESKKATKGNAKKSKQKVT